MVSLTSKVNRQTAVFMAVLLFSVMTYEGIINLGLYTKYELESIRILLPELSLHALWIVQKIVDFVLSTGGAVGAVFLIEATAVGWKQSSLHSLLWPTRKTCWYDIIIYALMVTGYFNLIMLWLSLGLPILTTYLWASFGNYVLPEARRLTTNFFVADIFIYYFVWTFFDYWNHRLFHTTSLWKLHRMHHSATELNVITSARNHPVALAIEPFIRNWPIALIGLSTDGVGFFNLVTTPYFFLIHSKVGWSTGWFGRWILISPQGHAIHHSNQPEHINKNISVCPLWDRLFGTWYYGPVEATTFGLAEADHHTNNLVKEVFLDLRDFGLDLLKAVKRFRGPRSLSDG